VITGFPQAILRALAGAGLSPDPARFNYICGRMYHFGELEHGRLLRSIGSMLERDAQCAVRLLGWGHVMTEFAVASLGVPGKPDPVVLALGALANLIVSTYDGLLDSGREPQRILLRSRLTNAGREREPSDPLIASLVDLYFERLSKLPYPHPHLHRTLRSAILRMYDAEIETAGSREFSLAIWRRKSALPFVIMGLPVWMSIPSMDGRAYRAHLNWLYRLGRFFGWIDDAADLDDDRAAHRLNYFSAGIEPCMPHRIARQGARILEAWDGRAPLGRYGRTLRQTFLAVTWSWLGTYKTGTLDR
jgi:hypothetical protein